MTHIRSLFAGPRTTAIYRTCAALLAATVWIAAPANDQARGDWDEWYGYEAGTAGTWYDPIEWSQVDREYFDYYEDYYGDWNLPPKPGYFDEYGEEPNWDPSQ